MDTSELISTIGILLNIILFFLKIFVGILFNSFAVLSDAFNSLTDIFASLGIFFAIKFSNKDADSEHPFGHRRIEPLAGLGVGVFAFVLGIGLIKESFFRFFNSNFSIFSITSCIILIISIIVKSIMAYIFIKLGNKLHRPAIIASGIDSRNDILISTIALSGVILSKLGYFYFDLICAILIGLFILYSAYTIVKENIRYLIGNSPKKSKIQYVIKKCKEISGVISLHDIKAHYVGNYIQIEIHIVVDGKINTFKSHEIGKEVQKSVESIYFVDRAFIHIDPQ